VLPSRGGLRYSPVLPRKVRLRYSPVLPRRGGIKYSPVLPRRYRAVLSSRLDKCCVANEDRTKVKYWAAEEGWTQV
jgi:hypothetical protein